MVDILQLFIDNMRIDLRGGNIRMTKHLLNGMKVSAVFQQVCRKGVAQHMWCDILFDICLFLVVFDDFPKALAGHTLAIHIDEQSFLLVISDYALPNMLHRVM